MKECKSRNENTCLNLLRWCRRGDSSCWKQALVMIATLLPTMPLAVYLAKRPLGCLRSRPKPVLVQLRVQCLFPERKCEIELAQRDLGCTHVQHRQRMAADRRQNHLCKQTSKRVVTNQNCLRCPMGCTSSYSCSGFLLIKKAILPLMPARISRHGVPNFPHSSLVP